MDSLKCLVCLKSILPQVKPRKLDEIDLETADQCDALKNQLSTIFLIRKFLELPQEFCCKLLEEHGDPNLWTGCCDSHSVLVERGKRVFDKIAILQQQYRKLQLEFKASLVSSFQSWENDPSASKMGTTELIRFYVKNGISNPKTEVPERNLKKLVETKTVNDQENGQQAPTSTKKPAAKKAPPKQLAAKKAPPKQPAAKKAPSKQPANKKPAAKNAAKKRPPGKKAAINDDIVPFAGQGHKLTDIAGPSNWGALNGSAKAISNNSQEVVAVSTIEKKAAAAAALARFEKAKSLDVEHAKRLENRQRTLIKELANKEMEEERKLKEQQSSFSRGGEMDNTLDGFEEDFAHGTNCQSDIIHTNSLIAKADRFTCPYIGPEILPRAQIEKKIREFLMKQPKDDVGVTCTLIHSLNKPEKVAACVETLSKCLDNIIHNPNDMKYRKIRCANKVYQERVAGVVGANEFLAAVGFNKISKENEQSGSTEEFWEFSTDEEEEEEDFVSSLTYVLEQLHETEPLKPVFDRNVRVLKAGQFDPRMQPSIPDDFYDLSPSELKLEQQRRKDVVEQETTLRTKAQREKDLIKSRTSNCRYCLIRIKLPDGYILQGTFSCREKILDVYNFVRESLSEGGDTTTFLLKKYGEGCLDNTDATVLECGLPPSAVLTFKPLSVPTFLATGLMPYLKSEILESAQTFP